MPQLQPNPAHTVPIDTAGEIATFVFARPGEDDEVSIRLVELFLKSDTPASYRVEFGTRTVEEFDDRHDEEGDIEWFQAPGYDAFTSTAGFAESWYQAIERIRIVVTDPAPANSTATLAVAAGR